jgi:hypothetical protein
VSAGEGGGTGRTRAVVGGIAIARGRTPLDSGRSRAHGGEGRCSCSVSD